MNILSTMHNHCTFCDGKSTPDEMISAAVSAGFSDFGMSCHGYAPFDPEYSIPGEDEYITAMNALKLKYAEHLNLYTGIEEDYFAQTDAPERYDYRIGAVHYAKDASTGTLLAVDGSTEELYKVIDVIYHGNAMDMVKDYYANMVAASERKPLIMAHFDLIVKYNSGNRFFDEECPEYTETALQALEACLKNGVVFEINTGAAIKKRRELPYPAPFLLRRLKELGGEITMNTDCHYAPLLTGKLTLAARVAAEAGFDHALQYLDGAFRPMAL
ncbi:MAG: PHP domain-containing protein [Oscillospiraceae bacterium]|nr:PHP domain-containing protein [Oscillospiraceae bacterium]